MFEKFKRAMRPTTGAAVPALKALPPATSSNLSTSRAGAYNTGISEAAIEQKGIEDGQVGLLDPETLGRENSHPDACDHLAEGHEAATDIIGYDLRGAVQAVDESLERAQPKVVVDESDALQAIDVHKSAEKRRLVQRQKMAAAGLPIPSKKGSLVFVGLMVLLFVGDWGLITLGFQIMGLPDKPWIPGVAFTDDLHLAALSSVVALVFLGEYAGYHIRRIEHALEQRRLAGPDNREVFPKPAIFDYVWVGLCLAGAIGGLVALSSIRTEYLSALGIPSNGLAFLGIQGAILAAAVALGFASANPEAKNWKSINTNAVEAETTMDAKIATFSESAGNFNADVDKRDTLIAQAGHHAGADGANVRGQQAAYKRRYKLSQLEPAQEKLFGAHLVPTEYGEGDLLARLTGITAFPVFNKINTQKVMNAKAASLAELTVLRARIDKIEIDKLDLPELDEIATIAPVDDDIDDEAVSSPATPLRPVPNQRPIDNIDDDLDAEADDEEVLA